MNYLVALDHSISLSFFPSPVFLLVAAAVGGMFETLSLVNRDTYSGERYTGDRTRGGAKKANGDTRTHGNRRHGVSRDPRSMTTTASRTTTAVGGGQSAWNEVGPRVRLG